jgi:hypothetical protein
MPYFTFSTAHKIGRKERLQPNLFREALYHLDHVKRNLPDHDRD